MAARASKAFTSDSMQKESFALSVRTVVDLLQASGKC